MNKPKAPKDMTAPEFVAYFLNTRPNIDGGIKLALDQALNEPAPNPFTPDQIAWMREEQRNGFKYAAMDKNGAVYLFDSVYMKDKVDGIWKGSIFYKTNKNFLSKILSWDDDEPLCFSDYAPLEGAEQ